jgi:thiol:disulfide interchange protein
MKRNLPFLLIIVAFAAVMYFRGGGGGVAPKPAIFADGLTIADAKKQVEGTSKVVLVMATADWCPPCQQLKRGALVDPKIESWVKDNAVAVYVDADHSPEIGSLAVKGIPTLVMYRGDAELGRVTGAVDADDLLSWFKMSSEIATGG